MLRSFWYLSFLRLVSLAPFLGCGSAHEPHEAPPLPQIVAASVQANPNNAISAIFSIQATGAVTTRVDIVGDPTGERATRDFLVSDEPTTIPLLALYPETDYLFRAVVASPSGQKIAGGWLPFRAGKLPSSIVPLEITATGPPPSELTMFAPIRSSPGATPHPAVVIDGTGRVVWYREASASLLDLQLQPNGHLTGGVGTPSASPYTAGSYREWDVLGNEVRLWTAVGHDFTDAHEVRLLDDGDSALLFGFEARTSDLSRFGGAADATVIGDVLQRIGRDGTVLFEWKALDHYALEDADDLVWQTRWMAGYDVTHANAIEILPDGDYLLSIRQMSEITRIDPATGAIRWRMGKGKGNQFRFVDDPKGGFWNMHAVRRLPTGHIILIDNGLGHTPPSSRAVEYEIDEVAMTARLVWSFEPGIASCCMGYAQRLPSGNTLVNLGADHRIFEVSPSGEVVWEARLPAQGADFFGIYRATRIPSLDSLR